MPPVAAKKLSGRTRRGWVVQQILRSIFGGQFKGGDRLVEEEVAATLGVSRTPIREAFSELSGIGLIASKPNHGAIVRPFGPAQIREIYHIRWVLEGEAARLATGRIDRESLEEMRRENQRYLMLPRSATWSSDIVDLDQRFHELISHNCGSARLAEDIGRYRELVHTIRHVVGNTAQAQDIALVEHTQVLDAIIAGDAAEASERMANHIRRGAEAAVHALFGTSRTPVV